MAQYYLAVDGQQVGPLEINQLIPSGMTRNSMVWTNGMANWTQAGNVPELAHLFVAPTPSVYPAAAAYGAQNSGYGASPSSAYGAYQQPSGSAVDKQKVDYFIMTNKDNFPAEQLPLIQQALMRLDESTFNDVSMMQFKSPMTALLLSISCGVLAIDRFYIDDIGMGIGKLCTLGGCCIWAIIDLFMIQGATREKNFERISRYL